MLRRGIIIITAMYLSYGTRIHAYWPCFDFQLDIKFCVIFIDPTMHVSALVNLLHTFHNEDKSHSVSTSVVFLFESMLVLEYLYLQRVH